MGVPPLAGSEWVLTDAPGRMIRIVLDSVSGEIQVAGKTYNNPQMPPWREILNDEDMAALKAMFVSTRTGAITPPSQNRRK